MPRYHHDRRQVFIRDTRKASPTKGEILLVTVDLTFDLEQIAKELGAKAVSNKSRKSKLACGITAEAVKEEIAL